MEKIPDRWEQYTNMGRQIPGTRFFAFKVPLKDVLLDNLPATVDPFGPRELMDHCPALGLVIDLTNTNRYYDPKLFEAEKIQYEKIKTEGHVIPKTFVIKRFFKVVEAFLEENACNDKLIGVHCTHGVNRTGYLICRYLIQQLGVPPDQAISDFNSARGHELERENYLENLRKAPWLHGGPSFSSARGRGFRARPSGDSDGFNSSSEGFTSRGSDRFNSSLEGFTPPYMPHQSRRLMRRPSGPYSPNLERLSRSPIGRRISFGASPTQGSHSFPRERLHETARPWQSPPASRRSRGNSQNFSNSGNRNQEGTMDGEKFKSPVFGKIYYEQYYKGQVLPQYDVDFYSAGWGGGFGPHRPHPRNIPLPQGSQRPRVYRGPRPYRTPPKLEEPFQEPPRHYQGTPRTPYARGSRPNPYSQGTPRDVFTPENDGGRRRSNRFQPY